MSIGEMIIDFNEKRIGHKEVLNRIDGYEDSMEKLNFMFEQALITADDFNYRKLVLSHPEVLTTRERRQKIKPIHSFLMEDLNNTLQKMKSKLRVHSSFEFPEYVNFRLPKNIQEIEVDQKLERYLFLYYSLDQFCKFLIDKYEYPYNATDLYFGEEFWINDENCRCRVIRNMDYISGQFKDMSR